MPQYKIIITDKHYDKKKEFTSLSRPNALSALMECVGNREIVSKFGNDEHYVLGVKFNETFYLYEGIKQ